MSKRDEIQSRLGATQVRYLRDTDVTLEDVRWLLGRVAILEVALQRFVDGDYVCDGYDYTEGCHAPRIAEEALKE